MPGHTRADLSRNDSGVSAVYETEPMLASCGLLMDVRAGGRAERRVLAVAEVGPGLPLGAGAGG